MQLRADSPTYIEASDHGSRRARGGDLVSILEAAYAPERDAANWLAGVLRAAHPILDRGCGTFGFAFRFRRESARILHPVHCESHPALHDRMGQVVAAAAGLDWTPTFLGRPTLLMSKYMPEVLASPAVMTLLEPVGMADQAAVVGHSLDGTGVALSSVLPKRGGFPKPLLRRLELVAAHLAAAQRMRAKAKGAGVEAVLNPNGKLLHAEGHAKSELARDALCYAGKAMERSRGRLRRSDPEEALSLWRALVEGRWSLVESIDSDGKRLLLARKNPSSTSALAGLSLLEQQVAGYAALGHSNKYIAYELGIAPSTVTKHLQAALAKLGLSSRTELIRVLLASTKK